MVSVISGSGLGLGDTSLDLLGARGAVGNGETGRAREQVYVNSATGNLVLRNRDELLAGLGPDVGIFRTYNSQGYVDGDNNDGWRIGVYRSVTPAGTPNTAGSTVAHTDGDGAQTTYAFDAALGLYVTTAGGGAHDTLAYDAGTQAWTWTDGDSRVTELYDGANGGRLVRLADADGNGLTYAYNATGLVTQVTSASGEVTYLDYAGANLTQIRTVNAAAATLVRTRYEYDAANRLSRIVTDLSPEDASVADGRVYSVSYTYDGASTRVASMTQTDGTSLAFSYVQAGGAWKVASITNALGEVTSFSYAAASQSQVTGTADGSVLSTAGTQTYSETLNLNGAAVQTTDTATYQLNEANVRPAGWSVPQLFESLPATASRPIVEFDSAGRAIAAWAQGSDIFVRHYVNGSWNPSLAIDSGTGTTSELHLHVDAASGNAVATWAQSSNIYAARYVAGAWQPAELVKSGVPSPAPVAAAINAAGQAIARWNAGSQTHAAVYAPGSGWSASTALSSASPASSGRIGPRVAIDAAGNGLVVWSDGGPRSAYVRSYRVGVGWEPTVALETSSSSVDYTPFVAFDANGNAIAAWTQRDGVYVRHLVGGVWQPEVRLSTLNSVGLNLHVDPSGNAVAVWHGGSTARLARFVNGAWQPTEVLGATSVTTIVGPSASINAAGQAVVLWHSDQHQGLVTSRWTAAGWVTEILAAEAPRDATKVAVDASGNVHALYVTNGDLYHSAYTPLDHYLVAAGDTWESIAATLYGDAAAAPALRAAMGDPTLSAGLRLANLPPAPDAVAIDSVRAPTTTATRYLNSSALVPAGWRDATTLATGAGGEPGMAALSGGSLAVWAAGGSVYAARHSGGAWQAPVLLRTGSGAPTGPVEIFSDDTSYAVAVWAQDGGLYAARYNGTWSAAVLIASGSIGNYSAATTYDRSVVTWTEGPYHRSYASIFSSGAWGAATSIDQAVYTGNPSSPSSRQAAMDSSGNAFVTWNQNNPNAQTNAFVNVWQASTGTWQGVTLVDETNAAVADPQIFTYSNQAILVWTQGSDVMSRTYNAGAWGASTAIDTGSGTVTNLRISQARNPLAIWDQGGAIHSARHWGSWDPAEAVGTGSNATAFSYTSSVGVAAWAANGVAVASVKSSTYPYAWGAPLELGPIDPGTLPKVTQDSSGNAVAIWIQGGQIKSRLFEAKPYYVVPAGATWSSIAQATYGSTGVAGQVQAANNYAALTTGTKLYNFAASHVETIAPSYTVQAGDTWEGIATYLYGSTRVAEELRARLGSPALTPGAVLSSLPAVLQDVDGLPITLSHTFTVPPYYTVQAGDTWSSVTTTLYGNAAAADELQSALGNPALTAGSRLSNVPGTLTHSWEGTPQPYYVVQAGDSWSSIAVRVYGDRQAASALQAATGNPALVTGMRLTTPLSLEFTRTADARVEVTDALGRTTSISYDAGGRMIGVRAPDADGERIELRYAYDANGNVSQAIDGRGHATTYGYDANGNRISEQDALGNTVTRTFGARNEVLTETVSSSTTPARTTRYAYDAEGHLRFAVSGEGRVTEHRYDAFGQRVSSIDYVASTYDVSALAQSAALTEAQLAAWLPADRSQTRRVDYAYDFRGQVSSMTRFGRVDAAGNGISDETRATTHYVRTQSGQLASAIDPRGEATPDPNDYATLYQYDGLGRLVQTVNARGEVTTTLYDDANARTTVSHANGLNVTAQYDAAGRRIGITESAGPVLGVTTYFHDAAGRLRRTVDPTGLQTHVLYDEAGRKVADIDASGSLVEYVLDRAGNTIRTIAYATAVAPAALSSLHDAQGKPTSVTLASIRPAPGQDRSTWNVHDAAGRLVKTVDAEGYVTQHFHDAQGRVTDTVRFATAVSTAGWGDAPLASAIDPPSSANDRHTRHFHDADGNLRGTLDGEGYLVEYLYDGAGQLTQTIAYRNATAASLRATGTLAQLRPQADAGDIHARFYYDASGRRTGEVDGEGSLTERTYDRAGNLASTRRYATRVTAMATLEATRPALAPEDQLTTYTHDALGRLETQVDPNGLATQHTYDSQGNRTATTRTAGASDSRTRTATYDVQGRLVAELSARGYATLGANPTQQQIDAAIQQYGIRHTYDAAGRRTSTTDELGRRTLFYYDADGKLSHRINAAGEVERYEYNNFGELEKTTKYGTRIAAGALAALTGGLEDAALAAARVSNAQQDSVARLQYNLRGLVSAAFDALGHSRSSGYNAFGDETSVLDERLTLETRQYDRRGLRTVSWRDAAGSPLAVVTEFDAFGRAAAVTRGDNVRRVVYDKAGREVQSIDGMSGARITSYDALGRVLTVRDPANPAQTVTTYTYDTALGTVTSLTPEGVRTVTERNRHGEVRTVTDGRGNVTTYAYDLDGNLTGVTRPSGHEVREYDNAGDLILEYDTSDVTGARTRIEYDAAGRVFKRIVDHGVGRLNLTTTTTYDARGNVVEVTDPNGVVTTYRWDLEGQLEERVVDPGGLALSTRYAYEAGGNTLSITQPNNTRVSYEYDALGRRRLERVDPDGLDLRTTYEYNARDEVIAVTDPMGRRTLMVRDSEDRVVFTVNALGEVRENVYDAAGRVVREIGHGARIDLALPAQPSVADVRAKLLAAGGAQSTRVHVYDADGRVIFDIDEVGGLTHYAYDGNGNVASRRRLAHEFGAGIQGYGRAALEGLLALSSDRDEVVKTVYDAADRARYVIDGSGAVTARWYDFRGNVRTLVQYAARIPLGTALDEASVSNALVSQPTLDRREQFHYDAAGRLTTHVDGVGAVTTRAYDANGNLVDTVSYAAKVANFSGLDETALRAAAEAAAAASPSMPSARERNYYDAANRLTWSVDGTGAASQRTYDAAGNVTRSVGYFNRFTGTLPAGPGSPPPLVADDPARDAVSTFKYDQANRLTHSQDGTGAVVKLEYDAAGNLVRRTAYATRNVHPDPALVPPAAGLDRVSRTIYDAANRAEIEIDASGAATDNTYDALGRLVVRTRYSLPVHDGLTIPEAIRAYVASPSGEQHRVERFVHDGSGRVAYAIDAGGFVKHFDYDAIGRVVATTLYARALGTPLSWTEAGVAAAIVADAGDRTESFVYDGTGRAVSSTDGEGRIEAFTYDGLGNRLSFTDKRGHTWNYAYDAAARRIREESPQVSVTSVTRNGQDFVASTVTQRLVTTLEYDALGNLLRRVETGRETRYEYDAAGRQLKTIHPSVGVYEAANDVAGSAARPELARALETRTAYNALGQAFASQDAAGSWSYKTYDAAGRVRFEIDAEGYVTGYERNLFGDAERVTRYANRYAFGAHSEGAELQSAALLAWAQGAGASSLDRTLVSTFDTMGRTRTVTEPTVLFEVSQATYTAGRVTTMMYNAFGQLVWSGHQLRHPPGLSDFASTQYWYDTRGNKVLEVDANKYATSFEYDAAGNLLAQTEFARKVSIPTDGLNPAYQPRPVPVATPYGLVQTVSEGWDRRTTYSYDRANRKIAETRENVEHGAGAARTTGSATTQYGYDAAGNLVRTTDALGASTYTYYDALGRARAVLAPSRDAELGGGTLVPLTEFRRDAHGNIVQKIERAGSGVHVPGAPGADHTYTAPAASGDDRVSHAFFDTHGRAIEEADATGHSRHFSYNARGEVSKAWQSVVNQGETSALVTNYVYDKLGRQLETVEHVAQAVAGVNGNVNAIRTRSTYNAFGELLTRGVDGRIDEANAYDNAGRLWRTNSGDGVTRIYLHDFTGSVTAELRHATYDLALVGDAVSALGLVATGEVRRYVNDAMGRRIEEILPTERLPAEPSYLPSNYIAFRQNYEAPWRSFYDLALGQTVSFAGGTVTRGTGDFITYRVDNRDYLFHLDNGPLAAVKVAQPLRDLATFYGFSFQNVPGIYLPGDFRFWYDVVQNDFNVYFDDLASFPVGQVISWMGGTLEKLDGQQARFTEAGGATFVFSKAMGPLETMRLNATIRNGWQREYGIRFHGEGGEWAEKVSIDLVSTARNGDENTVTLRWQEIESLGSGDVKVEVQWKASAEGSILTETRLFSAVESATGVTVKWENSSAVHDVDRVIVWKKDATGAWVQLLSQEPGQALTVPTIFSVAAPLDPSLGVSLEVSSAGGPWTGVAGIDLGERIWFRDLPASASALDYQVVYTTEGGVRSIRSTGTLAIVAPVLSTITPHPVTVNNGILSWGAGPKVYNPSSRHETLNLRPAYFRYDNYAAYRQLERDTLLFFTDNTNFPPGYSRPWMTGTLGKGLDDTAYFIDAAGNSFIFKKNDAPIEIAWLNSDIRRGWTEQYGITWELDPDAYFPSLDQGLKFIDVNMGFDDYFATEPIGNVRPWFGGTLTRNANGSATFRYGGEPDYTFWSTDGPLKVLNANARIRAGWSAEYGITFAKAQWTTLNQAEPRKVNISTLGTGTYQYELLYDQGYLPYAHAVGTVEIGGALLGGYGFTAAENALLQIRADTDYYFDSTVNNRGSVSSWFPETLANGRLVRGLGDVAHGAPNGLYSFSDVMTAVTQNANIRAGWGQEYGINWIWGTNYSFDQPWIRNQIALDTSTYFDTVAPGTWQQWYHGAWLYKVSWDTAHYYQPSGGIYEFKRHYSPEKIASENDWIRQGWQSDPNYSGLTYTATTGWRADNEAAYSQLVADTNYFLDAYPRGYSRPWFPGTQSQGTIVRGYNREAHYIQGEIAFSKTDVVLDLAKNNSIFRQGWQAQYNYPPFNLQFHYGDSNGSLPNDPTAKTYDIDVNENPGSTAISLPSTSEAVHSYVTTSALSPVPDLTPRVQRTYDRWGNLLTVTDPRNGSWITRYTYNSSDQVTEESKWNWYTGGLAQLGTAVNAQGQSYSTSAATQVAYDKLGRVISVKDANGHESTMRYDAAGQLVAETRADSGVVHHRFDAFGERRTRLDELSRATDYAYDKAGRLVTETHAATEVYEGVGSAAGPLAAPHRRAVTYQYDGAGRRIAVTNGANETTRYHYDERGRVVRVTQPLGTVHTTAYDAWGRKVGETDANGNSQVWRFDASNRLYEHQDLGGRLQRTVFDHMGRTTQLWRFLDSAGTQVEQKRFYQHGAQGRVTRIDASGTVALQDGSNRSVAESSVTEYAYDFAGNRTAERFEQNGVVYQDNRMTYDALGRLSQVVDARHHMTVTYDAVGNRRNVNTKFTDDANQFRQVDNWYAYDAMNRMTVENGVLSGGVIHHTYGQNSQGATYTYDLAGNRTSARQNGTLYNVNGGGGVVADNVDVLTRYYYDEENRLARSAQGDDAGVGYNNHGFQLNTTGVRRYDKAGRLKLEIGYNLKQNPGAAQGGDDYGDKRYMDYDANGRVVRQTAIDYKNDVRYTVSSDLATDHDAAGNLLHQRLQYRSDFTEDTSYEYRRASSYQQQRVSTTRNGSTAVATFGYDTNGHLRQVSQDRQENDGKNRRFVTNLEGAVLARVDGIPTRKNGQIVDGDLALTIDSMRPHDVRIRHSLVVEGKTLGNSAMLLGDDPQLARFDFGAQNTGSIGDAPAHYVLTSADVAQGLAALRGMAQAVYGDSTLWYVIAEANGIGSSADMAAGMVLTLPNTVTSDRNDFRTFKPYSPADVRGDTTPTVPQPQGDKGCGTMGTIILAVVAIVATIMTAGATAIAMGTIQGANGALALSAANASTIASAGVTALSGGAAAGVTGITLTAAGSTTTTLALAGAAAVGGAVGSIVSQGLSIATGYQSEFSWKAVAAGAIGAGVNSGLSSFSAFQGPLSGAALAARAAVGSAVTQGISVITGVQNKFSWSAVAASAIAAPLSQQIGDLIGGAIGDIKTDTGAQFGQRFASGFVSSSIQQAAQGGNVRWANIAADAFGNALGQSLVHGVSGPATPTFQQSLSRAEDANPLLGIVMDRNRAEVAAARDRFVFSSVADASGLSDATSPTDAGLANATRGEYIGRFTDSQGRRISHVVVTSSEQIDLEALTDRYHRDFQTLSREDVRAAVVRQFGGIAFQQDLGRRSADAARVQGEWLPPVQPHTYAPYAKSLSTSFITGAGRAIVGPMLPSTNPADPEDLASGPAMTAIGAHHMTGVQNSDPRGIIDPDRPGLYLLEKVNNRWIVKNAVDSVQTDKAAINGMLNSPGYAAWLMAQHVEKAFGDVEKFTLFYNPTEGVAGDGWESLRDKLGFTTEIAKKFSEVLQQTHASGRQVDWVAHSQGGIIFSEAARVRVDDVSGNRVAFHAGGNNQWITNNVMEAAGIRVLGYRDHPFDPVPSIAGFNTINPIRVIGSMLSLPFVVWGGPESSPHTLPYVQKSPK